MKNTVTRYLTAIIALPLVAALILWTPHPVFAGIVGSLFLVALSEWLIILGKIAQPMPLVFGLVLGGIGIAGIYLFEIFQDGFLLFLISLIIICGSCIFFVLCKHSDMRALASNASCLVLSVSIIVWSSGSISMIRGIESPVDGRYLLFWLLSIVWMGDTGAMHIGRWIGKHPLSPVISPKKTIEGLIGAILFGTSAGVIAMLILKLPIPIWHIVLLGPAIILLSHAGDLTKSIFKRAAGVKDSGTLIPGHGGFLDRLDNLFFTAPFLFSYIRLVWLPY